MAPLVQQLLQATKENEEQLSRAQDHFDEGDYIKALEIIEDSVSTRKKENPLSALHFLEASIFQILAMETENPEDKFTFLFGSVECFIEHSWVDVASSCVLIDMGDELHSTLYYRLAIKFAKESVAYYASSPEEMDEIQQKTFDKLIELAESKIQLARLPRDKSEPKSKDRQETIKEDLCNAAGKRLKSQWVGLDVEIKRNLMKVSTVKLASYVERQYGRDGRDALKKVLDSALTNKKWKFWICRTCSEEFFSLKKFKSHIEQEHAAKFKPSPKKHMAQKVDEVWARMISVPGWEPVDSVAAAEMIKTRLESVKWFIYENGWSKDWPLVADEERSKLLKEIQSLLVTFCERKILSCSMRDWMMQFPVKHLAQFEVSEHVLTAECRLLETPQLICFLECHELNQIIDFLKCIKCERHDGRDLVRTAAKRLWARTRVKEKIDFDHHFSYMLLDRRLLSGKVTSFDDEGLIGVVDHDVHYSKTYPQGDGFITWLLDYPLLDKSFEFPKSIRAHNLDTWVAVLRAIQFTCRTLGIKYEKKLQIGYYDEGLIDAKELCIQEDTRRSNIPEDQWNSYALLLSDKYDNLVEIEEPSTSTIQSLCAIRDILEEASHPSFKFPSSDYLKPMNVDLSDDRVLKSIDLLKSMVAKKVALADSKLLVVENSRTDLLDDLIRLSVFDYRSYILYTLKRFLWEELVKIVDVDAKAKAALSFNKNQEDRKKSRSKKKNQNAKKITSTSMSSPHDQNVKHESSVTLDPEVVSSSPKATDEDPIEQEDNVSSKRGQQEISSNTINQEEAAKDMQNKPIDDSCFEHLESTVEEGAVKYNLALAMTLKALCNIKVLEEYLVHYQYQFPANLEDKVPLALGNFFSAFVSKEIKEAGVHTCLISDLLTSLEEAQSMSSDAAGLLISIFEFCHCWKIPERESLITSHFTLVEYERMTCSKCRRKTNYQEQSSYGIVMAAESIRDLKCAFGNIRFEGILKVNQMEDKMLCDTRTGGCGEENFFHHVISRRPPIFTIVLQWEKNETEKEISDTAEALNWEIDISRLYEGLEEEPNTKYRLVSMVGCGEEEEYVCLAYKKNTWFSYRHEGLVKKAIGNWKSMVKFCVERKIRPEILFYEAFQWKHIIHSF